MRIDPDAVMWSARESDRAGRPLLVLLHGYGSHEGDLFGLSPYLPLDPVIASVRAPHRAGPGYAWFPLEGGRAGDPRPEVIDEPTDALIEWLGTLDHSGSVGMLGFSQGGAMALQTLRRAPGALDYAVCLAGFVAAEPQEGDAGLAESRPPVFWGRGTQDTVITAEAVERTHDWLPSHSAATIVAYEDLGHSISQAELADVGEFVGARLG